jgi:hypothetical protein
MFTYKMDYEALLQKAKIPFYNCIRQNGTIYLMFLRYFV